MYLIQFFDGSWKTRYMFDDRHAAMLVAEAFTSEDYPCRAIRNHRMASV